MTKTLLALAIILTACGDSTGPGIRCETEKRAELTARFGADYSPTPELLRQDKWTFGTTEITFGPSCAVTVTN